MSKLKVVGSGSSGNSYIVEANNGDKLLLDIGIPFKEIVRNCGYDVMSVVGCVITHRHFDHMLYYKQVLDSAIPCYSNEDVSEQTIGRVKTIQPGKKHQIGDFTVVPFNLPHEDVENYGYLISHEDFGKLLYMTDMEYSRLTFKNMKVDHLLIEANYVDELVNDDEEILHHRLLGHSALSTTLGIIRANMTENLKTITLCHLSETKCDPEIVLQMVKEIVPESVKVSIATKGLQVNL